MERPDFFNDNPTVCVNKLFNMIQACRVEASVMCGRNDKYEIDSEMIKVAEALVRELKQTQTKNS